MAPIYDNAGETTLLAAAEVAFSLVELMVESPVKSLADAFNSDTEVLPQAQPSID